jgi:hypothetical protein
MIKPSEWDTTEVITGDFKRLTLGGHVCQIKNAKIDTTTTGKEVLVIQFDIANGDCANFYTNEFQRRFTSNPDAKYMGVYRQLTEGNSLKFFKGLITAIENSNQGYVWNWEEKTLKGKFFGGVFGEEQYLNSKGEAKMSTKCRFIRSVDQVLSGVEIPKPKMLKGNENYNVNSLGTEVFPEEEIPFS